MKSRVLKKGEWRTLYSHYIASLKKGNLLVMQMPHSTILRRPRGMPNLLQVWALAKGTDSFLEMTRADTECLLCDRRRVQHCVYMYHFTTTLLSRCHYKWGNWGPGRLWPLPGLHYFNPCLLESWRECCMEIPRMSSGQTFKGIQPLTMNSSVTLGKFT